MKRLTILSLILFVGFSVTTMGADASSMDGCLMSWSGYPDSASTPLEAGMTNVNLFFVGTNIGKVYCNVTSIKVSWSSGDKLAQGLMASCAAIAANLLSGMGSDWSLSDSGACTILLLPAFPLTMIPIGPTALGFTFQASFISSMPGQAVVEIQSWMDTDQFPNDPPTTMYPVLINKSPPGPLRILQFAPSQYVVAAGSQFFINWQTTPLSSAQGLLLANDIPMITNVDLPQGFLKTSINQTTVFSLLTTFVYAGQTYGPQASQFTVFVSFSAPQHLVALAPE